MLRAINAKQMIMATIPALIRSGRFNAREILGLNRRFMACSIAMQ